MNADLTRASARAADSPRRVTAAPSPLSPRFKLGRSGAGRSRPLKESSQHRHLFHRPDRRERASPSASCSSITGSRRHDSCRRSPRPRLASRHQREPGVQPRALEKYGRDLTRCAREEADPVSRPHKESAGFIQCPLPRTRTTRPDASRASADRDRRSARQPPRARRRARGLKNKLIVALDLDRSSPSRNNRGRVRGATEGVLNESTDARA